MDRTISDYVFPSFEKENEFDIPKIIHFIWFGSKIRDKYLKNIRKIDLRINVVTSNIFYKVI